MIVSDLLEQPYNKSDNRPYGIVTYSNTVQTKDVV
jgi:hypothetical protein